jgi:hypothetical protein
MTPPTGAVLGHYAFHECNRQSFRPLPLLILHVLLFLHDLGCAQGDDSVLKHSKLVMNPLYGEIVISHLSPRRDYQ